MGRSAGIKLQLTGFDELLKEIESAGGTINRAVNSTMQQSAQIVQQELKQQMRNANVDEGLISRMPAPQVKIDGNIYSAKVGYEKGAYSPDNISDGYKAVFLNYGTPHRSEHGKITKRGFIQKAKKKSAKPLKKAQEETLLKILERLKR